jgi:hypothetical protein
MWKKGKGGKSAAIQARYSRQVLAGPQIHLASFSKNVASNRN